VGRRLCVGRRLLQDAFSEEMSRQILDDTEFSYRKHLVFDSWVGALVPLVRWDKIWLDRRSRARQISLILFGFN
jgi:hypothetical protein